MPAVTIAAEPTSAAAVLDHVGPGCDIILPLANGEPVTLLDAVEAAADHLELGGVMAIAPQGVDPEPVFARLAAIAADLRRDHPDATMLSAGMSGDLEAAVRTGATHVRVGRAVLGTRPSDG